MGSLLLGNIFLPNVFNLPFQRLITEKSIYRWAIRTWDWPRTTLEISDHIGHIETGERATSIYVTSNIPGTMRRTSTGVWRMRPALKVTYAVSYIEAGESVAVVSVTDHIIAALWSSYFNRIERFVHDRGIGIVGSYVEVAGIDSDSKASGI